MRSANGFNKIQKQLDEIGRLLSPARLRLERWPDGWVRLRWGEHKIVKVLPSRFWDAL